MNTILLQRVLNNIREPKVKKIPEVFINILTDRKAWKDIFRAMKKKIADLITAPRNVGS